MRFAAAVLSLAFVLPAAAQDAPRAAAAQTAPDTAPANGVALGFLMQLDAGKFAESWTGGAALLRGAVPQEQWNGVVGSMRTPLGAVQSRKLLSSTFTRTLPGAPDGDYVVVQYQTEFANKAGAIETVTPMREADGSWKVAGYFLK